jgi:hypothetical protein
MDRVFQIISIALLAVAAYFFWTRYMEGAFVSVVLACVSFFLSIRFQMKERNRMHEEERKNQEPSAE